MLKDTPEGTTHYFNDGCGEKAHNCYCDRDGLCEMHNHLSNSFEETTSTTSKVQEVIEKFFPISPNAAQQIPWVVAPPAKEKLKDLIQVEFEKEREAGAQEQWVMMTSDLKEYLSNQKALESDKLAACKTLPDKHYHKGKLALIEDIAVQAGIYLVDKTNEE